MPIAFYKILHILSAFALFAVLGGVLMSAANGVTKEGNEWRKKASITHGVGLLLLLISGFGLLAKNGLVAKNGLGFPAWAGIKLVLWLSLGALLPLAYRANNARAKLWWALLGIGFIAAYVGVSWREW